MRSDDGGKSIPRGPLHGLQRMNGTGQHMECHHSSLDQGNLLKGIDSKTVFAYVIFSNFIKEIKLQ